MWKWSAAKIATYGVCVCVSRVSVETIAETTFFHRVIERRSFSPLAALNLRQTPEKAYEEENNNNRKK